MEAIEREEELTDFVSTAKGVLQSLVEKHFPAPDRDKINRILGKNFKNWLWILHKMAVAISKNATNQILQTLYYVLKKFSFRYW